jgi:curved DNA-binding protein
VHGRDLSLVLPLAPWEAALGTKLDVPTPAGKVTLSVPADTQAGARLRLKGKGMPGKPPGDLFAVVKIVMPGDSTEVSRELFGRLAEEVPFNPRPNWEE